MRITIQCPNVQCRQIVAAEESISGRNVKCKKCGTAFRATPTLDGTSSETSPKSNTHESGLFSTLPAEFGRYRVEKLLGKGGMGAVYLALDSQLNRQVALKIPFFDAREEPKRLERFLREARSAARLHHPNICTVYDVGEFQGRPFITMAFITGKPLEDLFDEDRLLPVAQVVEIVRKTALAVEEAHNLSIIHRDLKPANIMITPAGEPVIMDFGLAKLVGETDALETRLTQEGALLGTPKYMAPEQVNGDQQSIGPATDVYALGVILFELLTGKTPYGGPLLQMLSQIASAPVPSVRDHRSDLDDSLDRVCRRAMSKRPADRFATMTELAEALGASGNSAEPIRQARSKGIENAALSGKGQAPASGSDPLVVPSLAAHVSVTNRRLSAGQRSVKVPAKVNSRSVRNRLPVWAWILSAATGLLLAGLCGAYFFRDKSSETLAISAQNTLDNAVRSTTTSTENQSDPSNAATSPKGNVNQSAPDQPTVLSEIPPAAGTDQTTSSRAVEEPTALPSRLRQTPDSYVKHAPGLIWSTPPGNTWWWCANISPRGDFLIAGEDPRDPSARDFVENLNEIPIRVWPIREGQMGQDSFGIRQPGSKCRVTATAFSSDGSLLAVATQRGSVGLWQMDAPSPVLLQNIQRFDGPITGLAISPNGKYLAAAQRGDGLPVIVWDIADTMKPKEIATWDLPTPQQPSALTFSWDSQSLFIGGGGPMAPTSALYNWSFLAPAQPTVLWQSPPKSKNEQGNAPWIRAIELSADGRKLGLAHSTSAYVIDTVTGKVLHAYRGHNKAVQAIHFRPDATECLTSSYDQSIQLWDFETGETIWQNDVETGLSEGIALSKDGRIAFSSSHKVERPTGNVAQLWRLPDTASGVAPPLYRSIDQEPSKTPPAAAQSDGTDTQFVAKPVSRPTPEEYVNHTPGLIWSTPPGNTWWNCATISPRGDLLVAGEDPRDPEAKDTLASRTEVPIRIWPLRDGQTGQDSFVIRQPGSKSSANAIRFSENGSLLAVALNSGKIFLWNMDAPSPELLQTLDRFDGVVTALAFSPDGKYLAAGKRHKGQPVVVWNIQNPRVPKESAMWDVPAPQEPSALVFSHDSQTLFIGAGGMQVPVADLYRWSFLSEPSARLHWSTPAPSPGVVPIHPFIRSLALSRDGQNFAAAFSTMGFVIDANSGSLKQTFRGHTKPVISIAFAGDGSQCISAAFDQSIRLWNISDGVQTWQNPSVTGSNEGLAVSADGRIAFSTSHYGTGNGVAIEGNVAQLWRLPDTPGVVAQTTITSAAPPAKEKAPPAEFVLANELDGSYASPTKDGLLIAFESNGSIWMAQRKSQNEQFTNMKSLLPGRHPTISSDGLEIIFQHTAPGRETPTLHYARRDSADAAFHSAMEIKELASIVNPKGPVLSSDGLTLCFCSTGTDGMRNADTKSMVVYSVRRDHAAKWSKPQMLLSPNTEAKAGGFFVWPWLSDDKLTMLAALEGVAQGGAVGAKNLYIFTRKNDSSPFTEFRLISDDVIPGGIRCPRFVPETSELFVTGHPKLLPPFSIGIIKNFAMPH